MCIRDRLRSLRRGVLPGVILPRRLDVKLPARGSANYLRHRGRRGGSARVHRRCGGSGNASTCRHEDSWSDIGRARHRLSGRPATVGREAF
eukprot:669870-Alexandrium_andersonii.AAC.1